MIEDLLREYVREALLSELSYDRQFINMLKGGGDGTYVFGGRANPEQKRQIKDAIRIAKDWIREVERDIGKPLRKGNEAQVMRYCTWKYPGLVASFRGNTQAAEHTLYNLLNSKFSTLRMELK